MANLAWTEPIIAIWPVLRATIEGNKAEIKKNLTLRLLF